MSGSVQSQNPSPLMISQDIHNVTDFLWQHVSSHEGSRDSCSLDPNNTSIQLFLYYFE